MKYCADNSNCGYRIVVNGTPECKCGEYCAYQRPNSIALQNNGYHWCTCGQSNNTKRICDVCGKINEMIDVVNVLIDKNDDVNKLRTDLYNLIKTYMKEI